MFSNVPFASAELSGVINQAGVTHIYFQNTALLQQDFTVNKSARYVRIQMDRVSHLALAEMQVFGCVDNTGNILGCMDLNAHNYDGTATIDDGSCALAIETQTFPNQYSIMSIYPNPFNPTTTISFSIPEFGLVTITAYDLTGRKLATIINTNLNPGNYSIDWNASYYPSGVYLMNMESSNFKQVQKVVLVK